MPKIVFAVLLAASIFFLDAAPVVARYSNSASGNGCCYTGYSHGGRTGTGAKKYYTNGIVKHCKKASCFKKHPSGEYYISPKELND